MSRSNTHLLAILPLLSVLSLSPVELHKRRVMRGIAAEIEPSFPKYKSLASKIHREALLKDENLDISKFAEKGNIYREKLMKARAEFQLDQTEEAKVKQQNQLLDDLVIGLMLLEEDHKFLLEIKAFSETGQELAQKTMLELKVTLEGLLVDKVENDLLVLREDFLKKEEAQKVAATPEEAKPAAEDVNQCAQINEQNKLLTTQVEGLITDQKKILENMLSLIQIMINQSQQMQSLPYTTGPKVSDQISFPMNLMGERGQWMYIPHGSQSDPSSQNLRQEFPSLYQDHYLGQKLYEEAIYQRPQFAPLPHYQQEIRVGDFGPANQMFDFGETLYPSQDRWRFI